MLYLYPSGCIKAEKAVKVKDVKKSEIYMQNRETISRNRFNRDCNRNAKRKVLPMHTGINAGINKKIKIFIEAWIKYSNPGNVD